MALIERRACLTRACRIPHGDFQAITIVEEISNHMNAAVLMFSLLALFPTAASAQQHRGYAGQERREIKSLSPEEVESLLEGQGMGQAKVAELNHHPGPRHALDLAAQLELSDSQRADAQRIFDRMQAEAKSLGERIVEGERSLDRMFASGEVDANKMREATRELALLRGSLRAAHLEAHLDMKRILTPAQVAKYGELRGYSSGKDKPAAHGHRKHGEH